jgi:hypothetical protein
LSLTGTTGEDTELFFRTVVFAGECKQLEEEGPALNVAGIVPDLDVQRRDGFLELSCFVEFPGSHCRRKDLDGRG